MSSSLCFLVEAADDICYHFIDFSDGFRLGLIDFEEAEPLLLSILEDHRDVVLRRISGFKDNKQKMEYLVGRAIGAVVSQVSCRFLQKEKEILEGSFDEELIRNLRCSPYLGKILSISKERVYATREVLEVEAAGFEVLGELLEIFVTSVEDLAGNKKNASSRSRKICQLLPTQFLGDNHIPDPDPYQRLLKITDFISGMTDSYAVTMYSRIRGFNLIPR